jgi:hypothetical protein
MEPVLIFFLILQSLRSEDPIKYFLLPIWRSIDEIKNQTYVFLFFQILFDFFVVVGCIRLWCGIRIKS